MEYDETDNTTLGTEQSTAQSTDQNGGADAHATDEVAAEPVAPEAEATNRAEATNGAAEPRATSDRDAGATSGMDTAPDMSDMHDSDMRDMADLSDATDMPDMSEMARLLDEQAVQFKSIKRGDVVEGQIVRIDPEEILVDIGLKSEGVLSTKELPAQGYGSLAELKVGDDVLVYIMQPETPEGHAVVSIRRARLERQWRIAQEQYERGELLEAEVIDHNKGGLIVNLEGIRGFVPISQILNLKREDTADNAETQNKLQTMVGRRLQLKIIEINRNRNRLILSERLAVQEWRQRRREELLNELEVGEVRKGVVSNLANFGAFVDLGGADGLVHISQLAWSRVNHPSEVLKVGQEVEVQVLQVDKEKKKIALSIKRAEVDPWTTVEERYHPGQLVKGTITKIAPFGAFARIEDGVEGLIHLSELPAGMQDPKAALREGQEVTVRILRIESDRRRLGLSVKQAVDETEAGEEVPATVAAGAPAEPRAEQPSTRAEQPSAPSAPPAAPREPEEPQTAFAAAFRAAQANRDRDQGGTATAEPETATAPEAAATPTAEAPATTAEAPAEATTEAATEVPATQAAVTEAAPIAEATPAEAPAATVAETPTADTTEAPAAEAAPAVEATADGDETTESPAPTKPRSRSRASAVPTEPIGEPAAEPAADGDD
jgi:small subunit ribosomal protein S1